MTLHSRIFFGLLLGVLAGVATHLLGLSWLGAALTFLSPAGTAFINLITMVVIPLVVASLVVGTASLGCIRSLGRMGAKTVAYYLLTTAIAVVIGLGLASVIKPGSRIAPEARDQITASAQEGAQDPIDSASAADLLDGPAIPWAAGAGRSLEQRAKDGATVLEGLLGRLIPRNPVRAAADFDLLGLIVFSVIFGAAISAMPGKPQKEAVLRFAEGINDACTVIIRAIMKLAPFAVFILVGSVIVEFGVTILGNLLVYALTVAGGLAIHMALTYGLAVGILGRRNPIRFLRRIRAPQLMAFSTSSSSATLPITMETAQRELGVRKETASFVLPLGATINMDGTALYQAVAVVFIANLYGIELSIGALLTVVATATMASVGAAGVPAAGIVTLVIVLNSVGLGQHVTAGIALILGVDRLLDMCRTSVNVTGDLVASLVIGRSEERTPATLEQSPDQADLALDPQQQIRSCQAP